MEKEKYVKVMFGINSGAKRDFEYKLNEVNIANNWNPKATNGREFGGFNYASEECILRWLHRGDTIYDVEIPIDAEVVKLEGATTVYRTNKIIIKNPRKVTDEMALEFYKKSKILEKSYYKALGAVCLMNYRNTALAILKDKINNNNIDEVLDEWNNFMDHGGDGTRIDSNDTVKLIDECLNEINSNLLISRTVDKGPYIKTITNDKVINVTGESGSGKSYFCNKYNDDNRYIVIDTDIIFSDKKSDDPNILKLREIFKNKPKDYLITNFDEFYINTLNYFKNSNKIIVIDSAQYRNIQDYSILKGKIIVMRTCVDTCYDRCINRWKNINKNYTEEDLQKYSNRKLGMYSWYKFLNKFLANVNKLGEKINDKSRNK